MEAIAMWLLKLRQWSRTNGLEPYLFGPLPSTPSEEQKVLIRDGLRYLHRAIETPGYSGDIADESSIDTAPKAIEFIKTNWLCGRGEEDILQAAMDNLTFSEDKSLQSFLHEFSLLHRNIEPIIPSTRAIQQFLERLPPVYDKHIATADAMPGRESVKDLTG